MSRPSPEAKLTFPDQASVYLIYPRDEAAKEGDNTDEEIDHFTSVPEDTPQPSSQAQARALDRLDLLLRRVEESHLMLASPINYSTT